MSAPCSPDRWRELGERLRNQCIVARWLGEQAVGVIRRELAQAWEAGRPPARNEPNGIGRAAPPGAIDDEPGVTVDVAADEAVAVEQPLAPSDGPAAVTAVPFEGYDTLPANHIVQRLQRMSPDELRSVGAYEAAHRNRSTVLGMVEQLLLAGVPVD